MDKILNSKFKKILAFFFFYYISNILLWYIFDKEIVTNATLKYGMVTNNVNLFNPLTNFGYSIGFSYYWLKSGTISIILIYLLLKRK